MSFPVDTLSDTIRAFNPNRNLIPDTPLFEALYVPRPDVDRQAIRPIVQHFVQSAQDQTQGLWYLTGHTGCGKSTELRRLVRDPGLTLYYHTLNIDVREKLDINNLLMTDIILTIAQECLKLAEAETHEIPDDLCKQITQWDQEIFSEKERMMRTEGRAGLRANLYFFFASEEIRSGGSQRDVVRQKVKNDLSALIYWINRALELIRKKTTRSVLCVLDGMDHMGVDQVLTLLQSSHIPLRQIQLSLLHVVPLPLLNTPYGTEISDNYALVPNLKVYAGAEDHRIHPEGLTFFTQLIERHCRQELFDPQVLPCLFEVSGGDVRDMIRAAYEACNSALLDQNPRVMPENAIAVWHKKTNFFQFQLTGDDYAILTRILEDPYLRKGNRDVPPLLHKKAILCFTNGIYWYSVHPVVKLMMQSRRPTCPQVAQL